MITTQDMTAAGEARQVADRRFAALQGALHRELVVQRLRAAELQATIRELVGEMDPDSLVERELSEMMLARSDDAVTDLRRALARMAAGTYGTCERCRSDIPTERLEVIPQARLCVPCSTGPGFR